MISQNKPNYLAAMGGEAGRHRVDAFLGNMGTKIFHANGDPETNKWASDMISEELQARSNWHGTMETGQGRGGGSESPGRKVLPSEFTMLKKGGPQNNFVTEAIVYQTGASLCRKRMAALAANGVHAADPRRNGRAEHGARRQVTGLSGTVLALKGGRST